MIKACKNCIKQNIKKITTVPGKPNKFKKIPANRMKRKNVKPMVVKKDNLLFPHHFRRLQFFKKKNTGTGDVNCGIGAGNGADQQCECKIADDGSAENIQS